MFARKSLLARLAFSATIANRFAASVAASRSRLTFSVSRRAASAMSCLRRISSSARRRSAFSRRSPSFAQASSWVRSSTLWARSRFSSWTITYSSKFCSKLAVEFKMTVRNAKVTSSTSRGSSMSWPKKSPTVLPEPMRACRSSVSFWSDEETMTALLRSMAQAKVRSSMRGSFSLSKYSWASGGSQYAGKNSNPSGEKR